MIKNILFDMGGVIFLQDTAVAIRRFQKAGIDTDFYMGAHEQKAFFFDVETGAIDADGFCKAMAAATGRPSVSWEEAQYCWLGFCKGVSVERLHYLTQLRKKYHLCLLSNTNPFIMAFMRSPRFSSEGFPINHYFDSLFCSYEIKHYKPSADFFKYALQTDNMQADECIFIDDSLKNVEAAEALGIHGLHVATNEDWIEPLERMLRADE